MPKLLKENTRMESISNAMRRLMERRNITPKEASEALGVSQSDFYTRLSRGFNYTALKKVNELRGGNLPSLKELAYEQILIDEKKL